MAAQKQKEAARKNLAQSEERARAKPGRDIREETFRKKRSRPLLSGVHGRRIFVRLRNLDKNEIAVSISADIVGYNKRKYPLDPLSRKKPFPLRNSRKIFTSLCA